MTLIVAPQSHVVKIVATRKPSHVLSLISPDADAPVCNGLARGNHGIFRFNDIAKPLPGLVAPSVALVDSIISFAQTWERTAPLLIHCYAGISRSTAAAYILACHFLPDTPEENLASALRHASPAATPNALMVAIADEFLRRDGRMVRAIASIGRGAEAAEGTAFDLPLAQP